MLQKNDVYSLLKDWCDLLLEYRVENPSPTVNGTFLCPACTVVHGRIADTVYPLTLLYRETGDKKYLDAAKSAIEWAEYNVLCEDGLYINDRGNFWKGISAFAAMAIGETLYRFSDILDVQTQKKWNEIFLRLTESCRALFKSESFRPHINYYAGAAALFAFAYEFTKDTSYLDDASCYEKICREMFDAQGLLCGEGRPYERITPNGAKCIDMGYNIEESLPLLVMHSYYLKDEEKLAFYTDRVVDHLNFMLSDGAVDNSFGTRHNKWTYWGSRTSDGLHEGFVYVAGRDKRIAKACVKNFELLKRCTHQKALFPGLMAHSAGEEACIHHAFTHAKSLATMYMNMNESDYVDVDKVLLPREEQGIKCYQGGSVRTVTAGDYTATVNACDHVLFPEVENGGGTLSVLWNKKYGPILASTTYKFIPTEPLNMQYQRKGIASECMTARFEDGKGYTTVKDMTVALSGVNDEIVASSAVNDITLRYLVKSDGVTVTVRSGSDGRFILPIISATGDNVQSRDSSVIFKDTLTVSANTAPTVSYRRDKVPYYHVVGGFEYVVLTYDVKAGKELKIRIEA